MSITTHCLKSLIKHSQRPVGFRDQILKLHVQLFFSLKAFMAPKIGNPTLCHEAASHISSSFTAFSVLFYSRWSMQVTNVFSTCLKWAGIREGLCCLHNWRSASRMYAFPGRRPQATCICTHTVHSEEKFKAASIREGQTSLWILSLAGCVLGQL